MTRGEEGGNDPWSAPLFTQREPGLSADALAPCSSACFQASLKPALGRGTELLRSSRANWSLRGPSRTKAEHPQPRFGGGSHQAINLVKRGPLLHHETDCPTVFSRHHVQSTLPGNEVNGLAIPCRLLDQSTLHIPYPDA